MSDGQGQRVRLTRERVLRCAVAVADAGGLAALTIRSLATELGVKPMSVYHHVASKDEILDGIVDAVFDEIELPESRGDWQGEIRKRAMSAREVLRRHSWAIGLMESRTVPGPATLRHHDAIMGRLRRAGFSVEMTAHAYALIDSYVYGFALQEAALAFNASGSVEATKPTTQRVAADQYPHLAEVAKYLERPRYDFGNEFEFGLSTILHALSGSLSDGSNERSTTTNRRR